MRAYFASRLAAIVVLTALASAQAQQSVSVLDTLKPSSGLNVQKTDDGLKLSLKNKKDAQHNVLWSDKAFKAPLIITAEIKTDSNELRLNYKDGIVILGWRLNPKELRVRDPVTNKTVGVADKGEIPKNTWIKVRWIIDEDRARVEVDGVERAALKSNAKGLSGHVGVSTFGPAVITLKSLTVTPISVEKEAGAQKVGAIDITIPSKPAASQPSTAPAGDPNEISRIQFRETPKRLLRDLSSVTAMMVRIAADGQASGLTSEIIAAVPAQSRSGSSAGIGLVRGDGDEMMKVALDEAVRAVTLRYPIWEPGHIDLSFGEKFESHGGPSAATGFALLMLSTLEGFEIDPKCAVTGDITVDWKVRKVGGVTAKLRGATLDGCEMAVIPTGNATAFADIALLYGNSAVWDIQAFSIATLQEAVAVARRDRSPQLSQAITLFGDLRAQLRKAEKATLKDPQTATSLQRILELAPNHLSARQTLAMCDGTAPKTLSANATMYQLSVLFYPFRQLLGSGEKLDRASLPAHVAVLARKRLIALRPIANKELSPLVSDVAALIEALDGFAAQTVSAKTLISRIEQVQAAFAKLNADPTFFEKLIREAY